MKRKLGAYERALAYTNEYAPLNAVSILRLSSLPDTETLRAAFGLLQHRHPLMRSHIKKENGNYSFEIQDAQDAWIDARSRDGEESWVEVAESELNHTIDSSSQPLVRIIILRQEALGSSGEILLNFQHTIIDASSAANLIHELMHLCQLIETGTSSPELPNLRLHPASDDLFPVAHRGLTGSIRKAGFLLRMAADEASYGWKTRSTSKPLVRTVGNNRLLTRISDESLTEALQELSRRKRIPLNSLLSAAMILAVNRTLYQGTSMPMRTISFTDLRPYLSPPVAEEHLGSYISMLRYTIPVSGNREILRVAQDLQASIDRSFRYGDKFIAQQLSLATMKTFIRTRMMRMASSALSFTGAAPIDPNFRNRSVLGLHGFISNIDLGPEYTAQVHIFADRLYWDIVYMESDMDRSTANTIADEIQVILTSAV